MDCFGTYFTHVQTCDDVRVQSATEWTASVHTLHMSKPVMTFVFKVLRTGLLRYILYTCPAGEHGTGRPAGPHGSGRPAGWQDCRPAGRGQNSEQIHGAILKGRSSKPVGPNAKIDQIHRPNTIIILPVSPCTRTGYRI